MYYDFCPHCGNSIGQIQAEGQVLVCASCGQRIGAVARPSQVMVEQKPPEPRCPACSQYVEAKEAAGVRSFVAHFMPGQRKMCPGSGKPVAGLEPAQAPRVTSSGKDLSRYMTRDLIRVIAWMRGAEPTIEQLTLEYLDKSERVRLQIDALRDILGSRFQMKPYPPALGRPHLAMWATAGGCVVARKHEQGGYQTMSDAELLAVVNDVRTHAALFS